MSLLDTMPTEEFLHRIADMLRPNDTATKRRCQNQHCQAPLFFNRKLCIKCEDESRRERDSVRRAKARRRKREAQAHVHSISA